MTMAGANPSLTVDVMANNAMLGSGLAQAEAQVRQSAGRMGSVVDQQMGKFGSQFAGIMARGLGAGMALQMTDASIRAIADAIRNNKDIPEAVLTALQKSFSSVPVFGAIQDELIPLSDMIVNYLFKDTFRSINARAGRTIYAMSDMTNEQLIRERRAELSDLRARVDMPRVESVSTALGQFRFGVGAERTAEQIQILERIESILQELGEKVTTSN